MEHLLFKEADDSLVDQGYEFDLQETLLYESRYRELVQRLFFEHEYYKRAFLYCLVDELLLSIRTNSLTEDRKFFKSKDLDPHKSKLIYMELLFYRYENRISLLDDLHFEKTKKFIDECMDEIKNIKMVNATYGALKEYMMNFFEVADQNLKVKTKEELIEEVRIYEARYKYIISLFGAATTELKERFIDLFRSDLLNSLSKNSICKDREYFTSEEKPYLLETYVSLLIWRYEEEISIFDDLNFEQSENFIYEKQAEIEYNEDENNPLYHRSYYSLKPNENDEKNHYEQREKEILYYKNHPEELQRKTEESKKRQEEYLTSLEKLEQNFKVNKHYDQKKVTLKKNVTDNSTSNKPPLDPPLRRCRRR